MNLETWELLSYVVTVIGLPLAIAVFLLEQRKDRENEEDQVYQLLADNYPGNKSSSGWFERQVWRSKDG